jgi:glycerol-3-phosphate responsive antiterminator
MRGKLSLSESRKNVADIDRLFAFDKAALTKADYCLRLLNTDPA